MWLFVEMTPKKQGTRKGSNGGKLNLTSWNRGLWGGVWWAMPLQLTVWNMRDRLALSVISSAANKTISLGWGSKILVLQFTGTNEKLIELSPAPQLQFREFFFAKFEPTNSGPNKQASIWTIPVTKEDSNTKSVHKIVELLTHYGLWVMGQESTDLWAETPPGSSPKKLWTLQDQR